MLARFALTGPPTAALTAYREVYLPWGGAGGDENAAPPAAYVSRVAAGGEDGAYLCGALEGGGELNQWPRAQPAEAAAAEARARGVPQPCAAIARRTNIAAARGVRRSNARGVSAVQLSRVAAASCQSAGEKRHAAVLHAVTGGRSRQLPEVSDRKRRAKWRLFGLYVTASETGEQTFNPPGF